MPLSPKAITEFQSLYSKEYGVVLTVEEAQIKARMLIELFKIIRATPATPTTPATEGAQGSPTLVSQSDPLIAPSSQNPSFESPLSKSLQH